MRTLGLDVSSSMIGVAVAERDVTGKIVPLRLEHIRLDNVEGMWKKYEMIKKRLNEMKATNMFDGVTHVAVEEALIGFSTNKSTANTIVVLIRINVLTSQILREMFDLDPALIPSGTARKLSGIKIQRKSKCGKDAKTQVFDYMCANDLSHVVWEKRKLGKKKGEPVEFAKDITDAYVIAKARIVQG